MNKFYPEKVRGRFKSPWMPPESLLFGTLPSLMRSFFSRPRFDKEHVRSVLYKPELPLVKSDDPIIQWIGHASFLIQVGGYNILVDPVFSEVSYFFPRLIPAGIALSDLPHIDFVLLSHNHPDHADLSSMITLEHRDQPTWLVADGDRAWLRGYDFASVYEFTWWQEMTYRVNGVPLTFTYLPSAHWSRRGMFDLNKSLWGSWMISCSDMKIYFAGDTSFENHFTTIKQQFGRVDVALLPIGPVEPHDWMQRTHMSGEHVLHAAHALNARSVIPMHWGTFPFGLDTPLLPIEHLRKIWHKRAPRLLVSAIGQKIALQ